MATTSRATAVRVATLRALTIVAATDTSSVADEFLQDFCEAVAPTQYRNLSVPVSLRSAALDGWALSVTNNEDVHLARQDDMQMRRSI